jgi:hypothetical protein
LSSDLFIISLRALSLRLIVCGSFVLKAVPACRTFNPARAHGLWTYETRQGRKAATVVCSTSAVVTLAFQFTIYDFGFTIACATSNGS